MPEYPGQVVYPETGYRRPPPSLRVMSPEAYAGGMPFYPEKGYPKPPIVGVGLEAYARGLAEYLNARVMAGDMNYASAKLLFEFASRQAKAGVDISTLPFYKLIPKQEFFLDFRKREAETLARGIRELQTMYQSPGRSKSVMRAKMREMIEQLRGLYSGQEGLIESPSLSAGKIDTYKTALKKIFEMVGRQAPSLRSWLMAPTGAGARAGMPYAPTYEEPSYMPAFEMAGVEGTEPWRAWFESRYPTLLRQFKATLPREGIPTERAEASWVEWLEKRTPELREQWQRLSPYQRGERPAVYAPRIRTVGF